jgi:hypothetical protein
VRWLTQKYIAKSDVDPRMLHEVWRLVAHTYCFCICYSLPTELRLHNNPEHAWVLTEAITCWTLNALSTLFLEKRENNFAVMVGHDIITLSLLGICATSPTQQFGIMGLVLHEATDIFLSTARIAKYNKQMTLAKIILCVLSFGVWPFCRVYCFFPILYAACTEGPLYFSSLCVGLGNMNVYFWFLLMRICLLSTDKKNK